MKRAKRAPKRRSRLPISRGLGGVPDVASLTEIVSLKATAGAQYTTNTGYRLYNMSLALCPRATLVAPAYQEYRIRRLTVAYKTTVDTFSGASVAVPQLYYIVDKKGAVPSNFTIDTLSQMGAIPRRFDDKLKKISWAPAVLQSALTDPLALTTGVASAQITPWLPTNNSVGATTFVPSDVDHFGLSWMAYIPFGFTAVGYDVDIFVDIEFRKPRFNVPAPSSPQALDWNKPVAVLGE